MWAGILNIKDQHTEVVYTGQHGRFSYLDFQFLISLSPWNTLMIQSENYTKDNYIEGIEESSNPRVDNYLSIVTNYILKSDSFKTGHMLKFFLHHSPVILLSHLKLMLMVNGEISFMMMLGLLNTNLKEKILEWMSC